MVHDLREVSFYSCRMDPRYAREATHFPFPLTQGKHVEQRTLRHHLYKLLGSYESAPLRLAKIDVSLIYPGTTPTKDHGRMHEMLGIMTSIQFIGLRPHNVLCDLVFPELSRRATAQSASLAHVWLSFSMLWVKTTYQEQVYRPCRKVHLHVHCCTTHAKIRCPDSSPPAQIQGAETPRICTER